MISHLDLDGSCTFRAQILSPKQLTKLANRIVRLSARLHDGSVVGEANHYVLQHHK